MDESTRKALEEIANHIDCVARWSDFDTGYIAGIVQALLLRCEHEKHE